ncbi:MAG: CBS domain-containing protein [Bacteroidales bacterium]|jgi:predicted transcriptional regulator|nr:CBS domain-containing protein [Bacteroidales bacterium]MDD4214268.1 CBS domain-containing protein [Bacteroidales bacterium]
MLAKDLSTDAVIPVLTSDTASYALKLMEDQKISHLPIVNNLEFLGLISENDIYVQNMPEEVIGNHKLSLNNAFVYQHQHILEVISIVTELTLSVIPVIDTKNRYLGSITLQHLLEQFSQTASLQNPGGIIIVERNQNDFSLEEIARIVEANDAKILSSYVSSYRDSMKLEVTLKINKMNILPILQTFERYNYIVLASFTESEYNNDLQDRYDSLMNFLNI